MGRRKKKISDYQAYQTEIEIPPITSSPIDLNKTANRDFSLSVFMRMIYSCLVDADFLDTEAFMKNGKGKRDSGQDIAVLLEKLENHIFDWLQNRDIETVNGRRTEILRHCLEMGESDKGAISFNGTYWRWQDNSFACICITPCSEKQNGQGYLCHSLYKYY